MIKQYCHFLDLKSKKINQNVIIFLEIKILEFFLKPLCLNIFLKDLKDFCTWTGYKKTTFDTFQNNLTTFRYALGLGKKIRSN